MHPHQPGQNIYGRNYAGNNNVYNPNKINNAYGNANVMTKKKEYPNEMKNKAVGSQKYADLEIQTYFGNGQNNMMSAKDLELKKNLDIMTNQYMAIFTRVNEMANHFSNGGDETSNLDKIKRELKEVDDYNAIEHGKFISELFDVSKDSNVLNFDYQRYKQNSKDFEEKLKKIISDHKYDVILSVNKNNSKENIKRIKNYISSKRNGGNDSNNNYNNNNGNYEKQNSYGQNNYNNYGNQNGPSQMAFVGGNDIYNNPNQNQKNYPPYMYGNNNNYNNQYENINDIGNGNIYSNNRNNNNYNNYQNQYGQNRDEKINVKLIYNGNEKSYPFSSNDSGELIFLSAMEIKDEPKIYDKKGNWLSYELLKDMKIGEIFKDIEPILNIY